MKNIKRREFLKKAGVAAVGAGCLSAGVGKVQAEEKTSKLTKDKEFEPGEKASVSGVYDVFHDKIDGEHHAHRHQVIVKAGTVFPRCKGCHQWVKFRFAEQPVSIDKDPHFET